MPKFQPLVQLCGGDGELLTQFIYSIAMGEVFSQYLKDKKEAIARVGNDKIRQNGMCVAAAVTTNTKDVELITGDTVTLCIKDVAVIVGVNVAVPFGTTDWAGLQFRPESGHESLKKSN